MSKAINFDETESLEELGEKLEDLRVRRNDLNQEAREELKPLEDVIRYGVEGLEGQHYLDPNHLIEAAAKAALPEEKIEDNNYTWEDWDTEKKKIFNGPQAPKNGIRTLNSSIQRDQSPVDRSLNRPVDQIIEDLPQTWAEADEMFSNPPEEYEVDEFFENTRELLDKADFRPYKQMVYDAMADGEITEQDFNSLIEWNSEIEDAIESIKDLGTAVLDIKHGGVEEINDAPSGRVTLPEAPEDFAANFTNGMINAYDGILTMYENTVEAKQTSAASQEESLPVKEYRQQIKVDDEVLPEEASMYEQQLFDAGARYNHESEGGEVDVDMMHKIVRDVRGLDVSDDLTPSYEDKQAEAYADLKGAVEAIVEDSSMTIGNGAGNRKSLNQLVAGIRYTEGNDAVYEDEHVIER